jgi:nicotinamidase-related amidase
METALLLIDIQRDYFPGGAMELCGSLEAAEKARVLLDAFRQAGDPVVHVQHISTRPGATFFLPNTDGVEIHPMVHPLPGEEVVVKHKANSFLGTCLQQRLDELGVKRLIVAGMMTHLCVDAGVRAASDLGFECVVAGDGCATRDLTHEGVTVPAAHVQASFLAALASGYARVLVTEQVIELLKPPED